MHFRLQNTLFKVALILAWTEFQTVFAKVLKCKSCLDVNFIDYQQHYQNPDYGRLINFPLRLNKYSCHLETKTMSICKNSCVTINIFKKTTDELLSTMSDCSTKVVQHNPHGFPHINYQFFNGSQMFIDDDIPDANIYMKYEFKDDNTVNMTIEKHNFKINGLMIFGIICSVTIPVSLIILLYHGVKTFKLSETLMLQEMKNVKSTEKSIPYQSLIDFQSSSGKSINDEISV